MILEKIKKTLDNEEFPCTLSSATEKLPFEHLLVFLGLDNKKRERMLEIVTIQQQISPEFLLSPPPLLPYRIQFRVQLPFNVQDIALSQVASLILFFNQFIDLPGFELNELEGQVFYRYVWIIHPTSIDDLLIMNIIGALILNVSLFSDTIESLADGKQTFNDLLTQITQFTDNKKSSSS
jgi:hypothetical protein